MSRDELGPLFRVATARRREEAVRDKSEHADVAAGVWKRVTDLSARDLFSVLELLGLNPVRGIGGEIVSLCPCCERPGATWTPKGNIN